MTVVDDAARNVRFRVDDRQIIGGNGGGKRAKQGSLRLREAAQIPDPAASDESSPETANVARGLHSRPVAAMPITVSGSASFMARKAYPWASI